MSVLNRKEGTLAPAGSGEERRVVIIGLDGTPYSLITRLAKEGELPHLARILEGGTICPMNSVLPTVSSVAWACFMTGKNPGKHGIYGFVDRVQGSYEIYIPNSKSMRSETLWEVLSRNGKRVVVINVPVTYPPRQVKGILVPGFLMPKLKTGTYPQWVGEKLEEMGYRIDVDPWQARESKDKLLEDLDYTLQKRAEAAFHFLESEPWGLFMLHIMETDRLHHFLWEDMEVGNPQYGPRFLAFYKQLDEFLGELHQRLERKATLIILSDHGFCTVKKEVYINHWLREKGWLRFSKEPPESWVDIDGVSKAYNMDPGRIYVNLKGREPRGSVEPGEEYERVRKELVEGLSGLQDPETKESIVERVFRREELYVGGCYPQAPDLVVMPRRGYDLKGSIKKEGLTDRGPLVGMHTYDDAFLYIEGQRLSREVAEIVDLMPTILHLMGVSPPDDLDGSSLI